MSDAASPSPPTGPGVAISPDERRRRRELVAIGVLGCVLALLGGIAFSLLTSPLGPAGGAEPARTASTDGTAEPRPSATSVPAPGGGPSVAAGGADATAEGVTVQAAESEAPAGSETPPTTVPAGVALVSAAGGSSPPTTVAPPPTPTTAVTSPPTTALAPDTDDGAAEPAP